MRLFVAIPIPDDVRESLQHMQTTLRGVLAPAVVRWTRTEGFHLTLRFLGDVDPSHRADLVARLQDSVGGYGEFDVACKRVGCFPNLRAPRVLWAGIADGDAHVRELQRRVASAVGPFAASPPSTQFTPHVTLARFKPMPRHLALTLADFVATHEAERFGQWRADRLELVRSELSRSGSRYETVAAIALR